MPNAFTPNADGENDVFRVPYSMAEEVTKFSVYNRWGELIFSTTNLNEGWDGTFGGKPQSPGTYVWMIEYKDLLSNKSATAKGTVILIRYGRAIIRH